ncbi:MAG TPA: NAD(P)-dependent oxidoreductase [Pyrinomonadaceae bacterium]|nr:NAD(P)-dependent oxidoreductase [Pyrinomonadaceae bacterium]
MPGVLILGAGLVGTFAARALSEEGIEIVVADLGTEPEYFRRFGPKECLLATADILDFTSISSLLKSCDVDVIVLTAGLTSEDCEHDPQKAWSVNVQGPVVVARAAIEAGVKRLVFISTIAVYGIPDAVRITESMPVRPCSEYGRTKAMAEKGITTFRDHGLDVRILRSCGVYGPLRSNGGSKSAKFIEALLRHALSTRELEVIASPNAADEYLYVKDLAQAVSLAALRGVPATAFIFNVGAGQSTTIKELCALVQRISPELRINISPAGVEESPRLAPLDTSLIHDVYGFKPQYSLAKGFFDYLQETGQRL